MMTKNADIKRGDIFYINRSILEQGSEQQAGRPGIIVSNDKNNEFSRCVEVVFLTTQEKTNLPTHVDIFSSPRDSIALCEQIHTVSVDRIGRFIAHCSDNEMEKIDNALMISIGLKNVAAMGAPPKKVDSMDIKEKTTLNGYEINDTFVSHLLKFYGEYMQIVVCLEKMVIQYLERNKETEQGKSNE